MTEVKVRKTEGKGKRRGSIWDMGMSASLILLLFRLPLANMIGNEGNGLTDDLSEKAKQYIKIPMKASWNT